jgi:hypothetical protein
MKSLFITLLFSLNILSSCYAFKNFDSNFRDAYFKLIENPTFPCQKKELVIICFFDNTYSDSSHIKNIDNWIVKNSLLPNQIFPIVSVTVKDSNILIVHGEFFVGNEFKIIFDDYISNIRVDCISKLDIIDSLKTQINSNSRNYKAIECNLYLDINNVKLSYIKRIIENIDNWQIYYGTKSLDIKSIFFNSDTNNPTISVELKDTNFNTNICTLKFGNIKVNNYNITPKNCIFDILKNHYLNYRKITDQNKLYAFDYLLSYNYVEWELQNTAVNLYSEGTFVNDNQTRNGSITKLGVHFAPNFSHKYEGWYNISIFFETFNNPSNDILFDIINKGVSFSVFSEIPHSRIFNEMLCKLNSTNRKDPVKAQINYLIGLKDNDGLKTTSRIELNAKHTISVLKSFLIKLEFIKTWFFNSPPKDIQKTTNYYAVSFGQNISKLLSIIPFFTKIFDINLTEDNNFLFFQMSYGRKPPAFQDIIERSIGYSVRF